MGHFEADDAMPEYFIEYLPRLQTTSVYFHGKVELLEVEKCGLTINGEKIELAHRVSKDASRTVTALDSEWTNIRIRSNARGVLKSENQIQLQDQYQWNIKDLERQRKRGGKVFSCGSCSAGIVSFDHVNKLLPMPSEMWYEMLDFWHCHKPNEGAADIQLLKKFNELQPNPNDVIVGSYYLIVNPKDWNLATMDGGRIECSKCSSVLGIRDGNLGNFKLFKWQISLNGIETFRPYKYVLLKLIEEMNYSAARVFTIGVANGKSLKLWCFGVDIDIRFSNEFGELKDCLKLMYQEPESGANGHAHIGQNFIDIEYETPFLDFVRWVETININLPVTLQNYKEWKVSYVPK